MLLIISAVFYFHLFKKINNKLLHTAHLLIFGKRFAFIPKVFQKQHKYERLISKMLSLEF